MGSKGPRIRAIMRPKGPKWELNMKSLDEMPVNDAITLYYEKHHALRMGDLTKLLEIKNKWPEIFDEKKDAEIRDMIDYAKEFQSSDRYKELHRLEMKKKLSVISKNVENKLSK
jgi:hypothetical protein